MNQKLKKKLRAIGHELKPVVTIAGNGLSENVVAELNRALDDHELIKIKIVGNREERVEVIEQLSAMDSTDIVQTIGGVALLYRPSREPKPGLSNILRSNIL
ncbi:MAG: ribosome assembly RNA-binding protein YhbY [Pseudomonadales bacterium]|nr:ribosome assembly RNA-binding protein YhbY [Pseudomonadales bacterium]MBO6658692.1 ribosome assembly RNA-binding protein YhbY [Pseudomonadales bacterium]MBO6703051.1 ribosome assembly RNA-binding protein YhbY [Pseudomonadales bacterium]MBO7006262.1 ribosome assembly RNA-binding protein YhbY [Pseudomonadales bacterium]